MNRIRHWLLACAAGLLWLAPASAGVEPYSEEVFRAAQADERPVLIDIYASWCPTCRRQEQILQNLLEDEEFSELLVLRLDWDAQRERAREFNAPRQSTLIAFRGEEERGRSVADTRPERIRALLLEALAD